MNSLRKDFYRMVIPSIISFAITGMYCFVDAFFVGNMVGDRGLAAINISFALISLAPAIGTGIGLGASVKYAVKTAGGHDEAAREYLGLSMVFMVVLSAVLTVPMVCFPRQILVLLGASSYVADIGQIYMKIQGIGVIISVLNSGITPILRNCGHVNAAMFLVVLGCLMNVFLDWLFVWVLDWGLSGASVATLLGQLAGLLISLVILAGDRKLCFGCRKTKVWSLARDIIQIGAVPFGLVFVPNISVMVLNKASFRYGGEDAIAAYGILAYLVYIIYLVIQGATDGAQPMISTFRGSGDRKAYAKVNSMTLALAFVISAGSIVVEVALRDRLGLFMGASGSTAEIVELALPILCLAFPCVAISRSIASILYASEKAVYAYAISFSEPLFILVCVLTVCPLMGCSGVWLSSSLGQFIVMLLSIALYIAFRKSETKTAF